MDWYQTSPADRAAPRNLNASNTKSAIGAQPPYSSPHVHPGYQSSPSLLSSRAVTGAPPPIAPSLKVVAMDAQTPRDFGAFGGATLRVMPS